MNEDIVNVEIADNIGLICLNKPPVNALGVALRSEIHRVLHVLLGDDSVEAIVLYGGGKYFSAGADIKDFGLADQQPTLPELLKAINNSPKPVVAALHGIAFGGALELALAAQVRVGSNGLQLALPEVTLGLLPGAGGTQRLPRLTGIQAALDIICTGRRVNADEALKLGIVSRLEEGAARDIGIGAANDLLSGGLKGTVTDDLPVKPDAKAIADARQRFAKGLTAPRIAIDSIEAASAPIDAGLAKERALFMQLMDGEERAGLVHAFFAERATSRIPEQAAATRNIDNVGIVGGGTMGVGIATAFLLSGFPVSLIELQAERVQQAKSAIAKNLDGALKRGKLTEENHRIALSRLNCSAELSDLSEADLVVEAIFEDLDVKTALFQDLDKICKQGAILATNTSYLDVNEIAAATSRPGDVIGLHFFSPAHIMRLLEVVVATNTAPELVSTAFELARKLRKLPVRAEVCDGFIGNRILAQYRKCCEYLLLDGASFEQIDTALENFGFAMGPFAVSDLAGLDISRATRQRKAATRPAQERYSHIADQICEEGWFGRKTRRGYYLYDEKMTRTVNPGAVAIVTAERESQGITPASFTDDEIVERFITAMIMESVNVLEDGVALRPVDIDAVKLFGYGFPRHRGGPMHIADQHGVEEIIKRIKTYAQEDSWYWQVPPLLQQMQSSGKTFSELNDISFDGA